MKRTKKIVILLLTTLFISFMIQNCVMADTMIGTVSEIAGKTSDSSAVTSVNNIAGSVITITRIICAGVAVIMITVLAMKYMYAAPSEKADVKKHAIPYVVGAIIMFSVTGLLTILQNFAQVFSQT